MYVLTRASFYHQSNNLIEVSKNLGYSPIQSFFKIILPSARPAIVAGLSLVAMECLADFGTVSFFSVSTLTTGIYNSWLSFDDLNTANQLSFFLVLIILLLFFIENFSRGNAKYHHSSLGFKPINKIRLVKAKAFLTTFFCATIFFNPMSFSICKRSKISISCMPRPLSFSLPTCDGQISVVVVAPHCLRCLYL